MAETQSAASRFFITGTNSPSNPSSLRLGSVSADGMSAFSVEAQGPYGVRVRLANSPIASPTGTFTNWVRLGGSATKATLSLSGSSGDPIYIQGVSQQDPRFINMFSTRSPDIGTGVIEIERAH